MMCESRRSVKSDPLSLVTDGTPSRLTPFPSRSDSFRFLLFFTFGARSRCAASLYSPTITLLWMIAVELPCPTPPPEVTATHASNSAASKACFLNLARIDLAWYFVNMLSATDFDTDFGCAWAQSSPKSHVTSFPRFSTCVQERFVVLDAQQM